MEEKNADSRIQFLPIYGCNPFEPICSLLKIDDFQLLLDCGWNNKFDEKDIENLKKNKFISN